MLMMLYLALYPETIVREEHDDAILICLYTDYNCFCTVVSSPMKDWLHVLLIRSQQITEHYAGMSW